MNASSSPDISYLEIQVPSSSSFLYRSAVDNDALTIHSFYFIHLYIVGVSRFNEGFHFEMTSRSSCSLFFPAPLVSRSQQAMSPITRGARGRVKVTRPSRVCSTLCKFFFFFVFVLRKLQDVIWTPQCTARFALQFDENTDDESVHRRADNELLRVCDNLVIRYQFYNSREYIFVRKPHLKFPELIQKSAIT